jgi:phage shock protein PspC (stress-responsive transcriptional regulator)
MVPSQRLVRPRDNRWIAGVCAGLARRFGMSPGMVRLLFLLSCLLPGPQFVVYLVLWIIMPNEDRTYYRASA